VRSALAATLDAGGGTFRDPALTMQFYNRFTDANERAAGATLDRLLAPEFHWSSTGAPSEGIG